MAPGRGGQRPAFQPFFRVLRNTKSLEGARHMVRYIAFRSEDVQEKGKGGFDQQHDQANVKAFLKQLPDRLTRHDRAPKAFHCLFSLSREQYDRLGITDWKPIVREVMRSYELETKRKLTWFATAHDNPTHPHCHVILKAVYDTDDGKRRKLWLSKDDLKQFRQITRRVLDYYREQARALEPPRPRYEADRMTDAFMTGLAWVQQQIRAEQIRRQQEEWEHQRWLREQERDERDR